jgi:hypothetical protein
MTLIELPRALEDYFAFAETDPTSRGRRFSISLPYFCGERIHRLQWWYHVSPAQELMYEGAGLTVLRQKEVERFRRHIERWLESTNQRLYGADPIPHVSARDGMAVSAPAQSPLPDATASSAAVSRDSAPAAIEPQAEEADEAVQSERLVVNA